MWDFRTQMPGLLPSLVGPINVDYLLILQMGNKTIPIKTSNSSVEQITNSQPKEFFVIPKVIRKEEIPQH